MPHKATFYSPRIVPLKNMALHQMQRIWNVLKHILVNTDMQLKIWRELISISETVGVYAASAVVEVESVKVNGESMPVISNVKTGVVDCEGVTASP